MESNTTKKSQKAIAKSGIKIADRIKCCLFRMGFYFGTVLEIEDAHYLVQLDQPAPFDFPVYISRHDIFPET